MKSPIRNAFSLVEVLAAVAIIGVITFLAIPNIVAVKTDAEQNLAISRAAAINMSMAAFIQAVGRSNAITVWATKNTPQLRYETLAPFLAFAPSNKTDFMPGGYDVTLPTSIASLVKVPLTGPNGTIVY
jgi:prepilin-type N-terminal cleavage/methylation domain-containing protein